MAILQSVELGFNADTATAERFIAAVQINQQPRAAYGRYILALESSLRRRGAFIAPVTPLDFLALNASQRASWRDLIPSLNAKTNDIAVDDMICLAADDDQGKPVAAVAARRLPLKSTVHDEMTSLRFFYGARASGKRATDCFNLTAPSAYEISGEACYLGGLWIRPDRRGDDLSSDMIKLIRAMAFARWNINHEIAIVTPSFVKDDVVAAYAFERIEPGFEFVMDGKLAWSGYFLCSSRAHVEGLLQGAGRNAPIMSHEIVAQAEHASGMPR